MDMQRRRYETRHPRLVEKKSQQELRRRISSFQRHWANLADNPDTSLPSSMKQYEREVVPTSNLPRPKPWDTSWIRASKARAGERGGSSSEYDHSFSIEEQDNYFDHSFSIEEQDNFLENRIGSLVDGKKKVNDTLVKNELLPHIKTKAQADQCIEHINTKYASSRETQANRARNIKKYIIAHKLGLDN